MTEETKVTNHHPADTNGDGKVSKDEHAMYLEFKRKELEAVSYTHLTLPTTPYV